MADYLRKNEIAKILGMAKSTVRYYEQEGLISPKVEDNNYRQYGIEEMKRLSQIHFMRDLDLDLETIHQLFKTDDVDVTALLEDKRAYILEAIADLQNKLNHIDRIIEVTALEHSHLSHKLVEYKTRYFYKLKEDDQALGEILTQNKVFFENHSIELGEWFVNLMGIQAYLDSETPEFEEYIEVSSVNAKEQSSTQYVVLPAGRYLCVNLVLNEGEFPNWPDMAKAIKEILIELALGLRGAHAVVVNNDNLNFNFTNDKRMLTVQIPVE